MLLENLNRGDYKSILEEDGKFRVKSQVVEIVIFSDYVFGELQNLCLLQQKRRCFGVFEEFCNWIDVKVIQSQICLVKKNMASALLWFEKVKLQKH